MKVLGNFPDFGKFPVELNDSTQDDMRVLGNLREFSRIWKIPRKKDDNCPHLQSTLEEETSC
jgi:hypothetical protein